MYDLLPVPATPDLVQRLPAFPRTAPWASGIPTPVRCRIPGSPPAGGELPRVGDERRARDGRRRFRTANRPAQPPRSPTTGRCTPRIPRRPPVRGHGVAHLSRPPAQRQVAGFDVHVLAVDTASARPGREVEKRRTKPSTRWTIGRTVSTAGSSIVRIFKSVVIRVMTRATRTTTPALATRTENGGTSPCPLAVRPMGRQGAHGHQGALGVTARLAGCASGRRRQAGSRGSR